MLAATLRRFGVSRVAGEKMRRTSTLQTTDEMAPAGPLNPPVASPRGSMSGGATRVWIRDAAAPSAPAFHADIARDTPRSPRFPEGGAQAILDAPRRELPRSRRLEPTMRASTRASPVLLCLHTVIRGPRFRFVPRGRRCLLPRSPAPNSRYFSHSTIPAGLADRPCIPADHARLALSDLADDAPPLARRLASLDLARSNECRAPLRVQSPGGFGLAPIASRSFVRHPDRGLPRAVLPALGGEPPRMTPISRTPFVVARLPAEEETST